MFYSKNIIRIIMKQNKNKNKKIKKYILNKIKKKYCKFSRYLFSENSEDRWFVFFWFNFFVTILLQLVFVPVFNDTIDVYLYRQSWEHLMLWHFSWWRQSSKMQTFNLLLVVFLLNLITCSLYWYIIFSRVICTKYIKKLRRNNVLV